MSARMDEGSPAALPSFSRCHVGSSILLSAASVKIRDDKLSAIAIGMLDRVAHADQLFDRRRRLLEHLVFPSSAPNVFSANSTRDWLPRKPKKKCFGSRSLT